MKRSLIIATAAIIAALAVSCGNKQTESMENTPDQVNITGTSELGGVTVLRDSTWADGTRELSVKPSNVCSSRIDVVVKDNVILNVTFTNGCPGNTLGVSNLIKGMSVDEAISRIEGIDCSEKGTSCPDQLSKALRLLQ